MMCDKKLIDRMIEMLKNLSSDERMKVFDEFCTHCGDKDPQCQCWNDE